ncbi:MAG: hypothetical protein GEV00_24110 [Actinophytocola sp.]|nr:hypothetical protein [Actinophytocola sp.]
MAGRPKLNRTAIEETVRHLRAENRLTPADEALVTLARRLAAACDDDSGNASLWREYRASVATLSEVGRDDGDVDEAAEFAAAVSTPVGNSSHPG